MVVNFDKEIEKYTEGNDVRVWKCGLDGVGVHKLI